MSEDHETESRQRRELLEAMQIIITMAAWTDLDRRSALQGQLDLIDATARAAIRRIADTH